MLGPQNDLLSRLFLAVASLCLLALVFVGVWSPRKMGDMNLVSWKKHN